MVVQIYVRYPYIFNDLMILLAVFPLHILSGEKVIDVSLIPEGYLMSSPATDSKSEVTELLLSLTNFAPTSTLNIEVLDLYIDPYSNSELNINLSKEPSGDYLLQPQAFLARCGSATNVPFRYTPRQRESISLRLSHINRNSLGLLKYSAGETLIWFGRSVWNRRVVTLDSLSKAINLILKDVFFNLHYLNDALYFSSTVRSYDGISSKFTAIIKCV